MDLQALTLNRIPACFDLLSALGNGGPACRNVFIQRFFQGCNGSLGGVQLRDQALVGIQARFQLVPTGLQSLVLGSKSLIGIARFDQRDLCLQTVNDKLEAFGGVSAMAARA